MYALIVCNGFPPTTQMLQKAVKRADLVVGADAGGNVLLSNNIIPDVVIGDMDSFKKAGGLNIKTIYDADQETNDLEKALYYVAKKGCDNCMILGAFGKRLDHALKNLSVMLRFHKRFKSLIIQDQYQKAILVDSYFETKVAKGTVVSLFPITGKVRGITTSGLQYALHDEELENGVRDGTSNQAVAESISVKVKEGALIVFIELADTGEDL